VNWSFELELVDIEFTKTSEELLDDCRRGDHEGLRLIFARYQRPVYNMLYRMLSSKEDAEEALAEVFVKVWRGARGFRGRSKFTTWLFRIVSNTAKDFLRSRMIRPEIQIEDVPSECDLANVRSGDLNDPLQSAIRAEEQAVLQRAVMMLSEEDRSLVVLYHLQGLDYDEVSGITGIARENLKVRLFRARQRLKRLLVEQEAVCDEDELRRDTAESTRLRSEEPDIG